MATVARTISPQRLLSGLFPFLFSPFRPKNNPEKPKTHNTVVTQARDEVTTITRPLHFESSFATEDFYRGFMGC